MNNEETTNQQSEAPETSRLKTMLWLGIGLLVYVGIQWMMPKVGLNS